jgi:hypothetical protein
MADSAIQAQPVGSRLRCTVCRSEYIVLKGGAPELSCCGEPLAAKGTQAASGG